MSDEDAELIKAGAQGVVEGAMKPFGELISSVFGSAASEAGEMLHEHVRQYRFLRQIRLLRKTQRALGELGVKPRQVPLKLLAPIIENASVEEENDLQDIWANLLANAANPEGARKVYPSFPAILKEMTSRDAKFLDELYRTVLKVGDGLHRQAEVEEVVFSFQTARAVYYRLFETQGPKLDPVEFATRSTRLSMDLLERQGIIGRRYDSVNENGKPTVGVAYAFTSLGARFVEACTVS